MTQNSMFFSDGSWYTQNMFARFLKDIFGHDGVVDNIDNELQVVANTPANMAVQVKTGRSYVQGYIHEILTDPVQLAIAGADPTNPRIDRVVLHLDVNTARSVVVKVLKGTASATPAAPALTQTASIWEISLAQVYVAANATVINAGNITDERTFMTYCRDNLPLCSDTQFGALKVGSGLAVSGGVVSMPGASVPIHCDIKRNNAGYGAYITNNNGINGVSAGIVIHNASGTTLEPQTCTTTGHVGVVGGGGSSGTYTGTITVTATNHMNGSTRVAKTITVSGDTRAPETGGDWNTTFTGYVGETFSLSYVHQYGTGNDEGIQTSTVTGNACYVNQVTW